MKQERSPIISLAIIFLGVTVLFGGGFYLYQRYSDANQVKSRLETENDIITNRIEVLRTSTNELSDYANIAYRAVPESNAGLLSLNTLRQLQFEEQVFVDGMFVKSALSLENTEQLSEVGFEVQGEPDNVFSFIRRISASLPLSRLTSVDTRRDASNLVTSTVNMTVHSKLLPLELPPVKEPLPDLTEEERLVLEELASYASPNVPTTVESGQQTNENVGRSNPFSEISGVPIEE